ncbi:alpha/beta hydrolase [Thermoproteota archaeon]
MFKNIVLLVVFLGIFFVWARNFELKNLFFPTRDFDYSPEYINLEYEDIYFETEDGVRINAWFIPAKNKAARSGSDNFTILLCHGNGGNISHRLDKISMLNSLGLNVFIYDYRGYGKNKGTPSESGFKLDTNAAYNYLVKEKNIPSSNIIIYGESLGGAVAVNLAVEVEVRALILESTFTSVEDMTKMLYPFFPTVLIQNRFDSLTKIKDVSVSKLFIHSKSDEIVPIVLGRKLYNHATEPKSFILIEGGHNQSVAEFKKQVEHGLRDFLDSL